MRHLPAVLFIVAALGACGGGENNTTPDSPIVIIDGPEPPDAPPPPDAREFDFSCMGNPAPTTAPATIALSGSAQDFNAVGMNIQPVADANVQAHQLNGDNIGANDTTDAAGAWELNLTTGGTPIDGYVELTKTGHRTVRIYPPQPLVADQAMIPGLLISNTTFAIAVNFLGAPKTSSTNAAVGLIVTDCSGALIPGVTVAARQGGNEVGVPNDLSIIQEGAFLIFDVPAGETEVTATFNGMSLRSRTVTAVAGETATTILTPGFAN